MCQTTPVRKIWVGRFWLTETYAIWEISRNHVAIAHAHVAGDSNLTCYKLLQRGRQDLRKRSKITHKNHHLTSSPSISRER